MRRVKKLNEQPFNLLAVVMKNGLCPKCGLPEVYHCRVTEQGGGVSFTRDSSFIMMIRDTYAWQPVFEWETYLCSNCGYFETYIPDKRLLNEVTTNRDRYWDKVAP